MDMVHEYASLLPKVHVERHHELNQLIFMHVFLKPKEHDAKPIKDKLELVESLITKQAIPSERDKNFLQCIPLNREIHQMLLYAMHERRMLLPVKSKFVIGSMSPEIKDDEDTEGNIEL